MWNRLLHPPLPCRVRPYGFQNMNPDAQHAVCDCEYTLCLCMSRVPFLEVAYALGLASAVSDKWIHLLCRVHLSTAPRR